ncbi:NUDIX hydrolase [Iamia sp.]|uniref:NUDIX hydrolase n=1 Tax=Iamia sp. TaxID=2722710 RepID=UPI002B9BDA8F|nr:NUDIX hydrolase [Iamia sp.]HXH57277.1 NUDIX hydrolase [Iamia sp.]
MTTDARHCERCGTPSPTHRGVPTCPDHGARWRMVRNAPCAAAVISDGTGRVLLSRRARDPFAGLWEVPGGFVELGEHPADAARREVREELGLDLTITGLVGEYVVRSQRSGWLQVTVYAGTVCGTPAPDPAEVSDWRWFTEGEVPEVIAGDHRTRLTDWWAGRTVALPARSPAPG